MGIQPTNIRFSITGEQLSKFALLLGSIRVLSNEERMVTLNGMRNHVKNGIAGVEDGANHFFDTLILYKGKYNTAKVSLNSQDGGKTYQGGATFGAETDETSGKS